jgi:hypothetical protein
MARAQGFRGSLRVVGEWATRRRAEQANIERLQRVPSARTLAQLLTTGRDRLTKAETLTVAAVEGGAPALVEAREVCASFQAMVRGNELGHLEEWLRRAEASLVASFARGIGQAREAPDVGPRQDRPAASLPDRPLALMISESASEPKLHAETHDRNRFCLDSRGNHMACGGQKCLAHKAPGFRRPHPCRGGAVGFSGSISRL